MSRKKHLRAQCALLSATGANGTVALTTNGKLVSGNNAGRYGSREMRRAVAKQFKKAMRT
jgi:hypothetical protein